MTNLLKIQIYLNPYSKCKENNKVLCLKLKSKGTLLVIDDRPADGHVTMKFR